MTNSSRTTTSSSTKSASPARPEIFRASIDPAGNVYEGPRQREYPMPPLRGSGFTDHMARSAPQARLEAVPSARRDQFAALSRPPGLRLSRLLQPRRMPHQRQKLHRRHHHSRRAQDQEPDHLRPRAGHAHRRGCEWPRHRRHLSPRRQGVFSARRGRSARLLHLRELAPAAAFEIEGLIPTASPTITARWAAIISATGAAAA